MKILLLMLSTSLLMGFAPKKESLVIRVDGWQEDTVYMISYRWGDAEEKIAKLVACNGVVVFDSPNSADTVELLFSAKKDVVERFTGNHFPLLLEAATIRTIVVGASCESIEGVALAGKLTYTSQGSLPLFAEQAALHKQKSELLRRKDANERLLEQSASNEAFFEMRKQFNDTLRRIETDYIAAHPNSQLSGKLTCSSRIVDFYDNYEKLSPDVVQGLFAEGLRRSKQRVDDYAKVQKNKELTQVGMSAPSFQLPALDGSMVSLESLRGKWVVLDFWGSWCGWCIKGIPALKEAYATHKGQLEVVGIACKDTDDKWREAVARHQLDWVNLFSDNQLPITYAIEGYPTKLLIDPAGIIRLHTVGDDPDFYVQIQQLLAK